MSGRPLYPNQPQAAPYYNQQQQPQSNNPYRRQPVENLNSRTSAYDVYDNYLNDKSDNRMSGSGALGLGLMNGSMDDDDEEDERWRRKAQQAGAPPSKHAALAAATRDPSPPPSYIAAPKPGYAAPVAAIQIPSPEPAAARDGRQQAVPPAGLRIDARRAQNGGNPFNDPPRMGQIPQSTPSPVMSTPHPLQPPITPITPVFARPQRMNSPDVKFQIPDEKEIIRGEKEETLLPRRGERGDDFWRRFSMVVKEDNRKPNKASAWLMKTRYGNKSLARWVWIVGLTLALFALAGIGLGWYLSHTNPDHQQPTAVGGSADKTSEDTLSSVGKGDASGIKTSFHVSPTLTVDRRTEPTPPVIPRGHRMERRSAHEFDVVW